MNIKEAVTTCMKKYVDFDGRATRSEYWWFMLAYLIVYILLAAIDPTGGILVMIYALGMIVPTITAGVRRMHDIDKSGWWLLVSLIPLVGLVLIYFLASKGTPGENRFGPAPVLTPAL